MGLRVLLQDQDITDFVDESSISFKSVLGQGTGSGGSGTGASSQASFLVDLGPIKAALGAGQTLPNTYPQAVLSDNPNAYWRMDDQYVCQDQSGNGNNGTVVSGPLLIVPGATADRNQGWEPISPAYVSTPLAVTSSTNVTLEALVYLTDAQARGAIVMIGDWDSGYGLGVGNGTDWDTPGDKLLLRIGAAYMTVAPAITLPVGEWAHVCAVLNGSSVTYYVNSVLSGTTTTAGSFPTTQGYIGTTSNGKYATNLIVDEIAVYSTALSAGRISVHYGARDSAPVLVRGGEVIIKDATGTAVFGGEVSDYKDASDALNIKTELDCIDYFQALDRIEVNEVFSGQTDIDIIRYIITNYAPHISLADIPATGTYSFTKRYIRAKSVKEALVAIAKVTGFAVWVPPDKKLKYKAPTEASTAPFSLSDDPDFIASFGYDIDSHTQDDNGIINRVYFYGGEQASPDFAQDLRPQANGSNKVFSLLYYPHDAGDGSIHVVKEGVELAVGSPFASGSDGKLISQGGTADVLLNRDARTLEFDVAPTTSLTQLDCVYRYSTPLVVVVSDRSSFQYFGKWYDGKLDDQSVLDSSTAIQRARVLLSQQSYGLETLSVTCHTGGLQAGMLLHVVNGLRQIDETYLVQSVTAKPEGAGYFEYSVSLGAWNWNLVDLLYAIARRAGVQDDATEENVSVVQAQETLEASTVAVIITLTSQASGTYYSGHFYSGFATVTS